jgi:hypothetical protein
MAEEAETIELRLPTKATILVYPSSESPGDWLVKANVEAIDVATGQPGCFTTTLKWHGAKPPRGEIAQTMINMVAHEICEQLGLDPHTRLKLPETPLVKLTDEEHAAILERAGIAK